MPNEPQTETPLGDLLPVPVKSILSKNGIHTVEEVRQAYPGQLLSMRGMGMLRFRQIEAAFFPGCSFTPKRVFSPITLVKGSFLNGCLSPATVRALCRGGVNTPEQLVAIEPEELLKLPGLGPTKLKEIEDVFYPSKRLARRSSQGEQE
ncbi:helix-hairpin-helix domain-containing protein [Comamonas sp.]|uniref:helix-hairpin-helix domain-containing protein n=1 Tax=Comamonas sp. TaxID=34028 RepID=UPI0028A89EF3|nr:helix-hairpin-helix domain-containing protein [Comamonas sp.]